MSRSSDYKEGFDDGYSKFRKELLENPIGKLLEEIKKDLGGKMENGEIDEPTKMLIGKVMSGEISKDELLKSIKNQCQ